jgi:hypothetical protein
MRLPTITFAFSIFSVSCLSGCIGNPCGYEPEDPDQYVGKTGKVAVYNAPEAPNSIESIALGETIKANDFIIELRLEPKDGSASSVGYLWSNINLSLFTAAHACSPYESLAYRDLTSLDITSNADFSDRYPAGTRLNDLFKVEYYYDREAYGMDIDDLLNPHSRQDRKPLSYMQLKLTVVPSLSMSHLFTVVVANQPPIILGEVTFDVK